jgi:hypothetical protein
VATSPAMIPAMAARATLTMIRPSRSIPSPPPSGVCGMSVAPLRSHVHQLTCRVTRITVTATAAIAATAAS